MFFISATTCEIKKNPSEVKKTHKSQATTDRKRKKKLENTVLHNVSVIYNW